MAAGLFGFVLVIEHLYLPSDLWKETGARRMQTLLMQSSGKSLEGSWERRGWSQGIGDWHSDPGS